MNSEANNEKKEQKPNNNPNNKDKNRDNKGRNFKNRNRNRNQKKRESNNREQNNIETGIPETVEQEIKDQDIIEAAPAEKKDSGNMIEVVGIRFKQNGKIYYFDPTGFELEMQAGVIVETIRGTEYGYVSSLPHMVPESELAGQLKPIIRIATEEDDRKLAENKEKEQKAFDTCLEKITEHGLDMKLVDVEYTFDGKKILFYFTSDGRVDFRELVKDLAGIYRTRIELRQIGVRDETRAMGGIGMCGREFCCHIFQPDFQPVSIRMAKDQNLSLNPSKIYGACGRLMCCIRYEEETYKELNKNLPKVGDETVTEDGLHGVVNAVNILRQKIKVIVDLGDDEKEVREYEPGMLKFTKKNKKGNKEKPAEPTAEELQILEDLKKDI